VFYSTAAVRAEIEQHGVVDPGRLVQAPLGVAPEFTATAPVTPAWEAVARQLHGRPFLLHVGSCIARKRIDVLLETVAQARSGAPELMLIKVDGDWTAAQQALQDRLGLREHVLHLRGIDRSTLACLYRHARLVLLPSAAEGFGLPLLEALACGAGVLASDLPVLREVGGPAACYAPPGDVDAWAAATLELFGSDERLGSVAARLAQAGRYSWQRHAAIVAAAYLKLAR
jgi:glycosyltransferase involved in cell wall biosynthesis